MTFNDIKTLEIYGIIVALSVFLILSFLLILFKVKTLKKDAVSIVYKDLIYDFFKDFLGALYILGLLFLWFATWKVNYKPTPDPDALLFSIWFLVISFCPILVYIVKVKSKIIYGIFSTFIFIIFLFTILYAMLVTG